MSKKYFKVCWSCGSRNLESYLTGVKCKDCGATHNELSQPGGSGFAADPGITTTEGNQAMEAHRRPSETVARRAAKARSSKTS